MTLNDLIQDTEFTEDERIAAKKLYKEIRKASADIIQRKGLKPNDEISEWLFDYADVEEAFNGFASIIIDQAKQEHQEHEQHCEQMKAENELMDARLRGETMAKLMEA